MAMEPQESKSESKKSRLQKKTTFRERNIKAAENASKPHRIRKTASAVKKPVSSLGRALTAEYHVLPRSEKPGFFTKSRSLAPRYFRDSWKELRQVTWPGRKETWKLVVAVFIFAILLGAFIAILDYGLEKLLREVIL
jgi:preprotein translocase SecE subunit